MRADGVLYVHGRDEGQSCECLSVVYADVERCGLFVCVTVNDLFIFYMINC